MSSVVDEATVTASNSTEPPPPPAAPPAETQTLVAENPVTVEEGTKEEGLGVVAPAPAEVQATPKVKITRRTLRSAAAPKDAETIELPEDLDVFWLPSIDASPTTTSTTSASAAPSNGGEAPSSSSSDLPPPEILDEALNKLLITLHPQVQHRAAYPTGPDPPVEPTLGLYCPIEGGEYVVDATVRELARRTGAEVLVLDSVQLAAGECGIFGKAANSLQLPVNPLHLPSEAPPSFTNRNDNEASEMEEDEDDMDDVGPASFAPRSMTLTLLASPQARSMITPGSVRRSTSRSKIKVFFDTLVNSSPKPSSLSPESAPTPTNTSTSTSASTRSSSPRPRIVYIRDFATLAPSSSIWYPPLLSAVRQRRRGPISRLTSPVANPITIVFGMTPSLTPPVPSGVGPSSNILSYLMNRDNHHPNSSPLPRQGGKGAAEKTEWTESEAAEKARERRLQERLRKWERHEMALFEEFPQLSALSEDGEGGGSEGKPEVVVLGSGGRGMPPILGQSSGAKSLPLGLSSGRLGGGEGEKKTSFYRSAVLVPAKRARERERETRMARRREINELAMRMGVGAVGGLVEETPAKVHFAAAEVEVSEDVEQKTSLEEEEVHAAEGAAAVAEKAPEMWDDWANRIEVWPNIKKIADSAVGDVLASTSQASSNPAASLEATVVPWDTVKAAWTQRKALKNHRRAWLKGAGHLTSYEMEEAAKEDGERKEGSVDEVVEKVRSDPELDTYEQRLLGCIVDAASMPTSFDQVHLPPHTIDSVRTIVSLPLLHPHAFQHGILKQHSMSGCLLFGPPGTGKTLVVRALAKDAGCRMLAITPSDIMDMYVGEAEKLVRAVFSLARRLSPCVVFLDEIDALFGARMSARESGGAAAAHRGVITEFMQEMDGLKSSKEDGVVVIGATNRPFDLDDAVLRRLPRRLLVDLPGEKEREGILRILLRDEELAGDVDVGELAKKTESFSGSDLKHLCVSAALDAVKERFQVPWKDLPSSTTATATSTTTEAPSTVTDTLTEATAPSEAATVQPPVDTAAAEPAVPAAAEPLASATTDEVAGAASATPAPTHPPRVLHLHNFTKALKEITPSSSESLGSLAELRKWNDEFGEGRRGRRKSPWGRGLFGFVDAKPAVEASEGAGKVAASKGSTTPSPGSSPSS